MTRLLVNGAYYHAEVAGAGPPLVLLHGFTGSVETWSPYTAVFGSRFRLVAIDLLGHGMTDSPPDPDRYRVERRVEDLLLLFDQLGLDRVNLLGYSMGGRIALHLAVAAPDRISRLVLESASPGIDRPADRAARIESDARLADLLERAGIEAFVDHWERLPLFASQNNLPPTTRAALRSQRLRGNPRGLANSLRGTGTGVMESLTGRLGEVRAQTLLVVGALDAKYCQLGQLMAGAMPRATLAIVPGAGHAVHLEQPAAFSAAVLDFLDRRDPVSGPTGEKEQ